MIMENQSKKMQELEALIKELEQDVENGFASPDTVKCLKSALESFCSGDKENAINDMFKALFIWATWKL